MCLNHIYIFIISFKWTRTLVRPDCVLLFPIEGLKKDKGKNSDAK